MLDAKQRVRITVERFIAGGAAVVSRVFVNSQFVCFGLEPLYKDCIPSGSYRVAVNWRDLCKSRRYVDQRLGGLAILVPDFPDAVIGSGHRSRNMPEGSLVVGTSVRAEPSQLSISYDDLAYGKLFTLVAAAAERRSLLIQYRESVSLVR